MYIVDSNCFIQNARSYNPMDIALSFWGKITDLAKSSSFFSIDKVKAELVGSNDELSAWAKALPGDFFRVIGTEELRPYIEQIVPWAAGTDYKQSAKDRFLQADYADLFLVAFAMAHENVVVITEEVSAKDSKKDIKLPDVCDHFGVQHMHFMDMHRVLNVTY